MAEEAFILYPICENKHKLSLIDIQEIIFSNKYPQCPKCGDCSLCSFLNAVIVGINLRKKRIRDEIDKSNYTMRPPDFNNFIIIEQQI